ncbi:class C sortase [Corynebacterium sp. L4756]|uniref:class C sortase n=1 Tax=unclassified Corynebacterium TaxID=2624378 RepID=UPI00374DCD50
MRYRQVRELDRGTVSTLMVIALVLLGVLFLMYPVASTLWNNYQAAEVTKQYRSIAEDQPAEELSRELRKAQLFNEEKARGPVLDPWLERFATDSPDFREYEQQLSSNAAMGRLVAPAIDVDLPIYHGTSEDTLQKGLGHLYGSDLPVGGEGTHSMITGHTGLPNASMFDNLSDLDLGGEFYLQVAGQKMKYQVDQIDVVLPHEVDALKAETNGDFVTLITCTPYGINTHRLLVRGHAVPLDADDARILDDMYSGFWMWWMTALVIAALIAVVATIWWLSKWRRRPVDPAPEKVAVTQS